MKSRYITSMVNGDIVIELENRINELEAKIDLVRELNNNSEFDHHNMYAVDKDDFDKGIGTLTKGE